MFDAVSEIALQNAKFRSGIKYPHENNKLLGDNLKYSAMNKIEKEERNKKSIYRHLVNDLHFTVGEARQKLGMV